MDAEMEQFCQDLLQSVHEMNTQVIAQKTEFQVKNNGTVIQRVSKADGSLKREKVVSEITRTRLKIELSQSQFANLLGVSVRTLQEWEQGRKKPSGAAKTLLKIAERHPEFLQELAVS